MTTPKKPRTRTAKAAAVPAAPSPEPIPAPATTGTLATVEVVATATTAPPVAAPEARTASVTVGLVKARGFGAWWIEWLAKGGWSHCVALVLPGGTHVIDARANVIDGVPAGVQIRPISYLKGEKCLWLKIPCTPSQAEAVEAAARSALGDSYDVRGIVDFATGQTDNSWKRKRGQDFFCSALGAWILWKGGVLGRDVLVPFSNIPPGDALGIYWGLGARQTSAPAGLTSTAS